MTPQQCAATACMMLAFSSSAAFAAPRVSHHGGLILNCEPPHFFDQTPGKDGKAASIQDFSLTASDNTDQATIKAWANNEPVEVKVTQERSGSFLVQGRLKEPVTKGKVWFRVNAESNDGCDDNSTWNVYTGN
ncbi:MAG: hypothetical protein WCI11_09255 [Candidatus Methylumidiphilus sp.]